MFKRTENQLYRWVLRRWFMICIIMLLAILTNVGIAYLCLWRYGQIVDKLEHIGSHYVALNQFDPVSDHRVWQAVAESYRGVLTADSYVGDLRPGVHGWPGDTDTFVHTIPRWLRNMLITTNADGTFVPRQQYEYIAIVACGWPFHSLYAVKTADDWRGDFTTKGGFVIESETAFVGMFTDWLVPYRPLWVGFAINTTLYAILIAVVIQGVVGARRLWRYERGLCPACAYDLRKDFSAGCAECGWRRG